MKVLPPVEVTDAMIVSSTLFETAPTTYAAGTTYALDAYASVAGLLGEILIYRSLQAGNIGNTPAISPTWWVYSSSTYAVYNPLTTYPLNYRVVDVATDRVKQSLRDGNTNRPVDNAPAWKYIGKINYPIGTLFHSTVTTYALDALVIGWIDSGIDNGADHNIFGVFKSKQASNTNRITDQVVPGVTIPPTPPTANAWWSLIDLAYPKFNLYAVYAKGEKVLDTNGDIYECQLNDTSRQPLTNAVQWWLDVAPSNRTAMFDVQTSTQSVANKSLSATITPGIIEAVGLINCLGDTATATLRDGLGGAVVWTQSSGIAGEQVSDWYQYFFNDPTIQRTQALFTGIPPYNNGHLTITITGGGTVAAGDVLAGRWRDVGLTGFGLQVGITDFSVVKEDEFGVNTFTKRGNKKYMNSRDWVKKEGFNRAFNLLRQLPATPCLWLAGDVIEYSEALMLKAFYKDFFIDIDGPEEAYCTLKLIGTI